MKNEIWLVFRNKATAKELAAYTLQGTSRGEATATRELLAREVGLLEDDISIQAEQR